MNDDTHFLDCEVVYSVLLAKLTSGSQWGALYSNKGGIKMLLCKYCSQ